MSNKIVSGMVVFIFLVSVLSVLGNAAPIDKIDKNHKENINHDINDKKCQKCHANKDKVKTENPKTKDVFYENIVRSLSAQLENYTTIISVGQAPYQIGALWRSGYTGWLWWDQGTFGSEKQKNIIYLTVLEKETGKPVTGLASPIWPQANFRNHSGIYSYKADTDTSPITTQNNYPDMADLIMIRKVNLENVTSANLTFWTWYSMEADWDYGYVSISTDGIDWTNIPGTLTTNTDPNGNNMENGITGNSGGNWIKETMDLTPFLSENKNRTMIAFRFRSDQAANDEGWYVDDIEISSGENIIFRDDAEAYLEPRSLSVNVTYPYITLSGWTDPLTNATKFQYTQNIRQIDLQEDAAHPGTYFGYFIYDPFSEQSSGNYDINLDTVINGTPVTAQTQYQTTIFGCENCHNKKDGAETSFIHGEGGGMGSCMYVCHSGSRSFYYSLYPDDPIYMGPPLPSNPMHVHEMKFGHQGGFLSGAWYGQPPYNVSSHVTNVTCTQCHTSFIHDNLSSDTFKVGNYTLYGKNITFSSGTHSNLTCENCHGDLSYPAIPEQYQINDTAGDYNPTFTSSESFTDTFIIDVNASDSGIIENLTINVTGDPKKILFYTLGPIDNTTTGLQGPCGGDPCAVMRVLPVNMTIPYPNAGTWLAKIILMQQNKVDYTITSNYPIQKKQIIKIPECKECHNSGSTGKAYTKYAIPDWNSGFAHADVNGDGMNDVQCRACHNAMHDITVKNCQDCHSKAPTNHTIKEPQYSQYTISQCLSCHGDPHDVAGIKSETCIECHGTNYTGENPIALETLVNISAFNESIHQDINKTPPSTLNNVDCWSCHYNMDMSRQNVRKCGDCHRKPNQWHGNANITSNLTSLFG